MYGQWCTAVPINDVGVPNILYVAHEGWCPVCSSPTSLAALSNLLLNLLLLLLLFAFCFLLLYLCLLIIYTRLRESNQETLISWNSGKRWPAYYPLYPAEPSVGLASFDAWLNLSIINCVPARPVRPLVRLNACTTLEARRHPQPLPLRTRKQISPACPLLPVPLPPASSDLKTRPAWLP